MSKETKIILLMILGIVCLKISLFAWAYHRFDFATDPSRNWITIWDRWDSGVYETIATQGYNAPNVPADSRSFLSHFPPLYPLLIALFFYVFRIPPFLSGVLISFLASIASSIFLYKLVVLDFGNPRIAGLAVFFLNIYPLAYFTIPPYSESLFILLEILSFYLLRRASVMGAALCGAGAILTRPVGINLAAAYAVHLWERWRRRDLHLRHAFLILLPFLAVLTYLWVNHHYYGDALHFVKEVQSNPAAGERHVIFPLTEMASSIRRIAEQPARQLRDKEFMMVEGWNAIFTLFALAVTLLGFFKKGPLDYYVFSLSMILFFSSFSWGISNARYTLPIFPIFVVLAQAKGVAWRIVTGVLAVAFVVLLFYFARIFTSGAWAF